MEDVDVSELEEGTESVDTSVRFSSSLSDDVMSEDDEVESYIPWPSNIQIELAKSVEHVQGLLFGYSFLSWSNCW